MPTPWHWRPWGRSSRTMTVIRCSRPWGLGPNCPPMDGYPMSSLWWDTFIVSVGKVTPFWFFLSHQCCPVLLLPRSNQHILGKELSKSNVHKPITWQALKVSKRTCGTTKHIQFTDVSRNCIMMSFVRNGVLRNLALQLNSQNQSRPAPNKLFTAEPWLYRLLQVWPCFMFAVDKSNH